MELGGQMVDSFRRGQSLVKSPYPHPRCRSEQSRPGDWTYGERSAVNYCRNLHGRDRYLIDPFVDWEEMLFHPSWKDA